MKQDKVKHDFKAFRQAMKEARKAKDISRNQLVDRLNIAPRYIASIGNDGRHPSLQIFYELVTFLDMSVDQFFFPVKTPDKTIQRRQLDKLLSDVDETNLVIVTGTVEGIQKAKEARGARETGE